MLSRGNTTILVMRRRGWIKLISCLIAGVFLLTSTNISYAFVSNGKTTCPASAFVDIDTDGDGLGDTWETDNFGGIGVYDGNDDPDNDGYSNLWEYKNGTDPNDPDDPNNRTSARNNALRFLRNMMDWRVIVGKRILYSYVNGGGGSLGLGWTYDNAISAIAFMEAGEWQRAKEILDAYIWFQARDPIGDGRIRRAYWANRPIDDAHVGDCTDWIPWTNSEAYNQAVGDMSFIMLAALRYHEYTGQASSVYLDLAQSLGDWINANARSANGAGGYNMVRNGCELDDPANFDRKSTENNLDAHVAFMKLFEATGDNTYEGYALHAKAFVEAMWSAADTMFWTGTLDDGITINGGANSDVTGYVPGDDTSGQPEDSITWGLMALKDTDNYGTGINWVETRCRVNNMDGYTFGYDFNADQDGIWFEGSSHVALTYQLLENDAMSDSILDVVINAQDAATGGIPCASHDGVTTSFDLWTLGTDLHVAGTAWFIFAMDGYNPFWGEAITAGSGGQVDENTKLLLHSDGTDGSTDFPDSSQSNHTVTAEGTSQVDTSAAKWGTGSGLFNGSTDRLSVPDSADWDIFASNSDDWTIDLWAKHASLDSEQGYISQYQSGGNRWSLFYRPGTGIQFHSRSGGSLFMQFAGGTITDNNWHHIAFCKVGSEYGIYIDGVQVAYKSYSGTANLTGPLRVGWVTYGGGDDYFDGNMDEVRIHHSNSFNAAPNSGSTDTITVPTGEYGGGGGGGGGNSAPALDPIGNKSVGEGDLLEFTITASDPDVGDTLTYSATNLPTGATFNEATQVFSWTPAFDQSGTYNNVHFEVTDSDLVDSEDITITVNDVNRKPVINDLNITPSTTIAEGESITIGIDATDPDGDSLSYQAQNQPDGSGFVDNDFYWVPGYDQAGVYSDITFTAFDSDLYSDPSGPVTITVTNISDPPVFITIPTAIGSYYAAGEAKDVKVVGNFAYVAYGLSGLKVLDISDIAAITEETSLAAYTSLDRLSVFGNNAYLIDSGTLVDILDVSTPALPFARGNMAETQALDVAVNSDTAYIACGTDVALYDVTDKDSPSELLGFDLGKADRLVARGDYLYSISEDEDLKATDVTTNGVISTTTVAGAEAYDAKDIDVSGNTVYVAKDDYGVVAFGVKDPESPTQDGEFSIAGTALREVEAYNKGRIFSVGYVSSTDNYDLTCIDSTDPAAMAVSWSYSFAQGLVINSLHADGNRLFAANQNGIDVIASPLEDSYTVEAESTLKITVYAEDPDGDSITYTMNNKPAFAEAVFTDNGDGTAVFTWTPTEAQIGTYENISFTAADAYQETQSNDITINVVDKETNGAVDENTKLLLHCNGTDGSTDFLDSSLSNHAITVFGASQIDTSAAKWGTGSGLFNGSTDRLSVPDSADWDIFASNSDDWTIDLWGKHASLGSEQGYISQYQNGDNRWSLFYRPGTGIQFHSRSGGSLFMQFAGGTITDNNWHHIAFCKVGSEYGIYIDGVQVAYKSYSGTANLTGPLRVGWVTYGGGDDYFDGNMDEVRIHHSNSFNAAPNSGSTDTITVPASEY